MLPSISSFLLIGIHVLLHSTAAFGGFISVLLIFPLWMWLKSRKERELLAQAISMADERRKHEAERIMRLAEAAPEKLTRAERAAVEGKAAWRESVSTWRESVTTAERSVDSMVGARPSSQQRGSMSSGGGVRASRESSKVYFPTTRPRYNRASTSSPTPPSFEKPVQEITEERNHALEKLMGTTKSASNGYAPVPLSTSLISPPDSQQIRYLTKLTNSTESASSGAQKFYPQQVRPSPVAGPSRSKETDGVGRTQETIIVNHSPPSQSPITAPVPTTMYGFHLPRPQAGRAYTMASLANSATSHDASGLIPLNHQQVQVDHAAKQFKDIPQPLADIRTTDGYMPKGKSTVYRDPLPRLQTTVLGPRPRSQPVLRPRSNSTPSLSRRPAQVRRPSAEVTNSPQHVSTPASQERPKSGGSSLSGRPSLSSEEVGEFAKRSSQVGPSWHRERMKKLHGSVSADDLTELPK